MKNYLVALDFAHLDNAMFLNAFAQALAKHENRRPIIVHGDSAYTTRIMQTGVMREDAKIRSIKDLNHRLIALLAEEGVSAVGIDGFRQQFIRKTAEGLTMNHGLFDRFHAQPGLVLSTLVWDDETAAPAAIPLPQLVALLQKELELDHAFAFAKSDENEVLVGSLPQQVSWNDMPANFAKTALPYEFTDFNRPLYLTSARDFQTIENTQNMTLVT